MGIPELIARHDAVAAEIAALPNDVDDKALADQLIAVEKGILSTQPETLGDVLALLDFVEAEHRAGSDIQCWEMPDLRPAIRAAMANGATTD